MIKMTIRSRTVRSWALVVAAPLLVVSIGRAQDQRPEPGANPTRRAPPLNLPPGDAVRGAELYVKNGCWQCHGYTAATGTAPALVLTGFNAEGFVNYLRNPRTRAMPLYSAKVVPDAAGADLFAFIKAQKKPAEAKDIPLLQRIIDEK